MTIIFVADSSHLALHSNCLILALRTHLCTPCCFALSFPATLKRSKYIYVPFFTLWQNFNLFVCVCVCVCVFDAIQPLYPPLLDKVDFATQLVSFLWICVIYLPSLFLSLFSFICTNSWRFLASNSSSEAEGARCNNLECVSSTRCHLSTCESLLSACFKKSLQMH